MGKKECRRSARFRHCVPWHATGTMTLRDRAATRGKRIILSSRHERDHRGTRGQKNDGCVPFDGGGVREKPLIALPSAGRTSSVMDATSIVDHGAGCS
jgi:hypothetical protein